jgi:prephenate dehydrogenase
VLFNKVAILGMGLLGGSLGKALRRRGLASCVAGYARRHETVQACLALDAAHVASTDPLEVVQEADLVVLGTRGLSGVAAFRAGSIATSLASHAPCSVLTARAN